METQAKACGYSRGYKIKCSRNLPGVRMDTQAKACGYSRGYTRSNVAAPYRMRMETQAKACDYSRGYKIKCSRTLQGAHGNTG